MTDRPISVENSSSDRAEELQQLLDITCELGGAGDLHEFLQKLVVRSAEFLGFRRSFVGICERGVCAVKAISDLGTITPYEWRIPAPLATKLMESGEPTFGDHFANWPTSRFEIAKIGAKEFLAIPLIAPDKTALGVIGVFGREGTAGVSEEDLRRAKAFGTEAAMVLQSTQNLRLAKENRDRAENLMNLALELNSSLRLPQFVRSFTQRAADMLNARAAVLALAHRSVLESVIVHDPESVPDKSLLRKLNVALTELASGRSEAVASGPAGALVGDAVAQALHWKDLVVARLRSGDGELIGLLCLVDLQEPLKEADRNLLHVLAAHASVALENARLFTRMDQANRHWVEIFDSITDFIVVHDESNQVLRVNRTLADFIGVRPSELIGVSMRALVAMANDNSAQPCPFCRVGLDGADEYVHPVLERTYLVSTSRIHGALNEAFQTIHVLKDITDRREAERRYRELFDTIQEGLFFSTPDGRFIEVNDALVRMLGYDEREQLLQVDIPRALYLVPEQRDQFRTLIEADGVLRNYEEALIRKDGSIIHTLQNAFAVRDGQGKIIQYRGLMLDITEQKNFQAELQRQRDFNNKILNNTQSMILVADTAGLISYANKRCYEAGGYTQAELLGRRLSELVAPGRRELLQEALETTIRGQQVDNLELPILLGRGRVAQFAMNLSPMRDESGNVSSIVVVMTDVSDAAMLQAKLVHTEKMAAVGQLVSGVAHEVNNPLTAILGFADLLIDHPDVPEFAKSDLRVILEEAQRTKQIVQSLLSFARQMPPQRKPVQINAILRQTLALRAYDFANHGVKIVERFTPNVREVVGDSHQLQQVFLNIINNAYDAVRESESPGRIVIETVEADNMAEIVFRDNGPGILYPERIFDPFFTTKEVGKGTGLGLSICYGIIREHQGEISCRNSSEGTGAEFIVRLPLASEEAMAAYAAGASS